MTPAPLPPAWDDVVARYAPRVRTALAESILPFWSRAVDGDRGGVFSCWNNAGTALASRDKFVWSQGRFVWMGARLSEAIEHGLIPGDASLWRTQAQKTAAFLTNHALLPDGRCAFRLTEDGQPQEAFSGSGPAPSIYADCFVAMGCAELARVTGDRAALNLAWQLTTNIARLMSEPEFPTWPTPIPAGYDAFAPPMILLNIALTLHRAAVTHDDSRAAQAGEICRRSSGRILDHFTVAEGKIMEFRARPDFQPGDTLLSRLTNPGHTLEGAWMLLNAASFQDRADWLARTTQIIHSAFARGWDAEYGGIFYYVDTAGGEPRGEAGDTAYERGVRTSWDTKLWWPHSEALAASLACYRLTGDTEALRWFERMFAYVFRTFPNPDAQVGEWIQIRDRRGAPLDRVVALPVKDPYHITRNLLQMLELFDGKTAVAQG